MNNQLKTIILLGLLSGLLLGIGQFLAGKSGLAIAFAIATAMNLSSYYFSDKIVLTIYKAKPLNKKENEKLHSIISKLSKEAKIPKPKIAIIKSDSPNAFATGRNPETAAVAFTEGILKILDENELAAVAAHEIGHIKNRDALITTIAATIATTISYIAAIARFTTIFGGSRNRENGGNLISLLVIAIITPIIVFELIIF